VSDQDNTCNGYFTLKTRLIMSSDEHILVKS